MSLPQTVNVSASPEVQMNENAISQKWTYCYAIDPRGTTGLTRRYSGDRWGGFDVSQTDHTFGASATTYVSVDVTDGTLDFSTSSTNFDDDTNFKRVEVVVSGASAIDPADVDDYRGGPGGVHGGAGGTGGGGGGAARNTVTALTVSAGVVDIDYSLGDYFTLAPTANVTSITFSNLPGSGKGASLWIRFTQDSTPRTVAWPASFKWEGGAAGSVSTGSGAKDVIAITTTDNGTAWDVTLSKARS